MTAPIYNQIEPRLYALSSTGDANITGYWAGYFTSATAQFGATAQVQDAWDDTGGVYLFLNQTPADMAAFAATLQTLLPQLSPQGWLRFLWISNPNDVANDWQMQILLAVPTGSSTPLLWSVIRQQSFTLGSYALRMQGGATLTLANTDSTGYGALIATSALGFNTPGCGYPAQNTGFLSFTGPLLGAITFPVSLSSAQGDDFAQMSVLLRYVVQDKDSSFGETKNLSMPVLANPDATVIAAGFYFDPLNPLLTARSGVGIYNTANNPALSSAFVSTRGYAITLTPANGNGALAPARLGFCKSPLLNTASSSTTSALNDYYLTPDGAFTMQVTPPAAELQAPPPPTTVADQFMFGTSGIEAVTLDSTGNSILFFEAGNAAYVPPVHVEGEPALQMQATTAYATVLPAAAGAAGLTYYAQPLQAPLFQSAATLGTGFLDFHSMPSGALSSYNAAAANQTVNAAETAAAIPAPVPLANIAPVVLPIGAYKWLTVEDIKLAKKIEEAVLAPSRRALVLPPVTNKAALSDDPTLAPINGNPSLAPAIANPYLAVTPQGLVAKLTTDLTAWAGIVLAHMPASQHTEVELTKVGDILQAALQANQLFFVVSNVDTFMKQSSVRYQLTELSMQLLAAQGVPATVITALQATTAYGTMPTKIYETEKDFLKPYPADPTVMQYQLQVLAVAGLLETDMEGWTFQLSPRAWRKGKDAPTMMLFKFCNRSLADLVNDGNAWNWPEAAWDKEKDGTITATQTQLRNILSNAAIALPDSPLGIFHREVASNALWNGVLFFNAPVDFTEMPQALQFLAAGIDTKKFYAHHIGFAVTPFVPQSGGIDLKQTAAFGLIDYEDPQDLVASSSIPFGFKTLQLKVRFANAQVVDFAAQVELMVNALLGSPLNKTEPARGNNLIMQGSCQRIGGVPSYNFALTGQNVFAAQNTVLVSMDVLSIQLLSGTGSTLDTIVMKFVLAGNLRFAQLVEFDLFSYGPNAEPTADPNGGQTSPVDGYLRFGSLAIAMNFQRATPAQQNYTVDENGMTFDMINSVLRSAALANNFPLIVSSLIASPNLAKNPGDEPVGQTPEEMGFTSISCPLEQTPMVAPWYGLVFNMDLGTLGALADSVGFTVSVLAAWKQGQTPLDMPVYMGLKLPNSPALGGSIPLQGILRLGFRSFEFSTYLTTDPITNTQVLGYMLTLRRLALSILAWSFPPGNTDIRIFGAPGQPKSSVGWYAVYEKDDDKKKTTDAPQVNVAKSAPLLASGPVAENTDKAVAADDKVRRRLRSGRRTPRAV